MAPQLGSTRSSASHLHLLLSSQPDSAERSNLAVDQLSDSSTGSSSFTMLMLPTASSSGCIASITMPSSAVGPCRWSMHPGAFSPRTVKATWAWSSTWAVAVVRPASFETIACTTLEAKPCIATTTWAITPSSTAVGTSACITWGTAETMDSRALSPFVHCQYSLAAWDS